MFKLTAVSYNGFPGVLSHKSLIPSGSLTFCGFPPMVTVLSGTVFPLGLCTVPEIITRTAETGQVQQRNRDTLSLAVGHELLSPAVLQLLTWGPTQHGSGPTRLPPDPDCRHLPSKFFQEGFSPHPIPMQPNWHRHWWAPTPCTAVYKLMWESDPGAYFVFPRFLEVIEYMMHVWSRIWSHVQFFATPQTIATKPLCPWDFPGKNKGVGCHLFLHWIYDLPLLYQEFIWEEEMERLGERTTILSIHLIVRCISISKTSKCEEENHP